MIRSRRRVLSASGALLTTGLAGCSAGSRQSGAAGRRATGTTVTVGAKGFAENRILGHIAAIALSELTDASVQPDMASSYDRRNWAVLQSGPLDVYWEYTGTIYTTFEPTHETFPADPQALYDAVVREAERFGVVVFPRAPFDNSFVLVADRAWSEATGVRSLSDLAAHVSAGNTDFGVAVGNDFRDRPDGWPGLTAHYEFDPAQLAALETNVQTVPVGITYELAARGDASVVMGYRTDPQLSRDSLVVLEDDRDFFPTYNPVPVADATTVERGSRVGRVLARLGARVGDETTIRRLNGRVVDGTPPAQVARTFLEAQHVV